MAYSSQIGASTVFMEASGESDEGMRAVAHCLVNRMKSGKWGKTLAAVCLYPFQFSCWNTKDGNRLRLASVDENDVRLIRAEKFIKEALEGEDDPTDGALFYYNPAVVKPKWDFNKLTKTVEIGKHVFFKEKLGA